MIEKIKELGFEINGIGMASGCLAVLLLIKFKGAAYVYEDIWWVLAIETAWAIGTIAWGIERLIKDLRG